MNEPEHIIDKVFLEVNATNQETAFAIRDNISSFLESELFPELEKVFDKYDVKDSVILLHQLKVEVGIDKWENSAQLKTGIAGRFQGKLQLAINNLPKNGAAVLEENAVSKLVSLGKNAEAAFLWFLEHGRLPWYGKEEQISEIAGRENWNARIDDDEFFAKLKQLLKNSKFAASRLVLQFPEELVLALVEKNKPALQKRELPEIVEILKQLPVSVRKLFLKFLLSASFGTHRKKQGRRELLKSWAEVENNIPEKIRSRLLTLLEKIDPGFLQELEKLKKPGFVRPEKEGEELPEPKTGEVAETRIPVQNAGLILLHPFLKLFFEEFKIIDKNGQLFKPKQELAVQVLHFLATGNEEFFEGNMVFEKFMCKMPLKWPIQKESLLTLTIKEESETLLNSAIKNWAALKNTSANGLRHGFLQRPGKLFITENNVRLVVERKTQDVLLDKLNWNILVVKLPWMKKLIQIEW